MKKQNYIRIVAILLAIGFLTFGVFRGEAQMVLKKGTQLCLECVGIG